MPYRRLPTTDVARLRAMSLAAEKAEVMEINQLAYSARFIHPLRNYHQQLESLKNQQTQSRKQIAGQNKKIQITGDKAKLFLTHFIQVLNMCIDREEIPASARRHYGLDPDSSRLPRLNSNQDLDSWGKRIIEGETKRIRAGGNPIMNPTIGKVKVWYDQFKDLYHSQQIANKTLQRVTTQLGEQRRHTDALIQLVWNEIEEFFQDLPDDKRRSKCEEYGIVYVFRKNETVT